MTTEITLVDRIICAAALAWKDDGEVLATGLVIRDLPLVASNFRSQESLSAYLNGGT